MAGNFRLYFCDETMPDIYQYVTNIHDGTEREFGVYFEQDRLGWLGKATLAKFVAKG